MLINERRVLPDRGRLGCADHYATCLERDLEAVGLDGAHLTDVLKTEEVHNLEIGVRMSLNIIRTHVCDDMRHC